MNILIANIIAFIASIIMVCIGLIKNKKKMIYVQTIQILLFVLSNVFLNAVTGIIINSINCIRNILCYNNKLNKNTKIVIIIISIVLSLSFNNNGIIGFLPLIGSVIYTMYMNIKNIVKFKFILAFSLMLWFVYDVYVMSYTAAFFDLISVVSSCIGIYQIKKKGGKKYDSKIKSGPKNS